MLKKHSTRGSVIGWFLALFITSTIPHANAATVIHYDTTFGNSCGAVLQTSSIYANKVVALSSVTINTINVLVGTGGTSNFLTSRYYIMANNPTGGSSSNGAPSTVLATFTPDSIAGTGSATVAKFVGSYSVSAGTKYWIAAAQSAATFPMCYMSPSNNNIFAFPSLTVDTSTSGTNSAWLRAYVTGGSNPVGASWTVALPDSTTFQFSLEYNAPTQVTAALTSQSGLLITSYKTSTPLRVSVDTPSKVTFYANGKVIAKCRNILSSAGVATCNWLPSVHGSYRIYATANPISTSYIASSTSIININVAARTNRR